jgi:predicted O-methyltransferase YrrM
MKEPFDMIFVDLEFSCYLPIVKQIIDRGLLAPGGVILVDNGKSFCSLFLFSTDILNPP